MDNVDAALAAFEIVSAEFKVAFAKVQRSKSARNVAAYRVASDNLEAAAEVCRAAQTKAEVAARRAERLAKAAPRRALAAAQMSMF